MPPTQPNQNRTAPLGFEGEVIDLRQSEPVNSPIFIAQHFLIAICVLTAWALVDLWEGVVWFAAFASMTTIEKLVTARLPDRITAAQFNTARATLVGNAVIVNAMPVYLWFHPYEPLKLGALAIVSGIILNDLNTRARYVSILACVQVPSALMFLVIGGGIIWQSGFSLRSVTAAVVTLAIVAYLLINLRVAHIKEKQAADTRAQLQYAQRTEVLGQVTGGIAHDFNNILSVVYASLELLRDQKNDAERRQLIDQAFFAVENGTNLTRQMLAFGRRAPLVPEVVDVNASLQSLRSLLVRVIPATIDIRIESTPEVAAIKVDNSTFHSALINLALNARGAMPDGGTLTLRARNAGMGSTGKTASSVMIDVCDTGQGIPEGLRDRVFDPFFTTKDVGEGSGLGLSMVKGFAEQSGGAVQLTSAVGEGTRVTLTFPAATHSPSRAITEAVPQAPQVATGHILLVDDNEQLLSLLSTKLQRDGHQISAFASGDEAVQALDRGIVPDLILSDVVMRGRVQGTDLMVLSRQRFAQVPVILMSGYADLKETMGADPSSADAFMTKPLHLADLTDVVNRLMPAKTMTKS